MLTVEGSIVSPCKLPGEIREGAETFSDETSSLDYNRICWNPQDCSMIQYKPARGRCREMGDMCRDVCFDCPCARFNSDE